MSRPGNRRPDAPGSDAGGPRARAGGGGARQARGVRRSGHAGGRDRARDGGALWIGGRRAVGEALRAGLVEELAVLPQARTTPGLRDLLTEAERAGVQARPGDRASLDGLAPDHQGVVARVRPPTTLGETDLAKIDVAPAALVVVLDGITDPQNLGAAARVADAAGASLLVTRERRAAGITASAIRASAGALLHLPTAVVANIPRALDRLKDRGFTVVGLDEDAERSVYDAPRPDGPLAVVLGSEGEGLSRLVRESCDELVRLPMLGRVASLNASAALSAALFAYVVPARELGGSS